MRRAMMCLRDLILCGCLLPVVANCGGQDASDTNPGLDAGSGGGGGSGGNGGGGGRPWSEGSADFVVQWHQAIRCEGSSRSSFARLNLLGSRAAIGGWVDGNCALFEGAPTPTEDEEPMVAALEANGALAWSARYAAAGDQRFRHTVPSGAGIAWVGSLDTAFDLGSIHLEPLPSSDNPHSTLFLARGDVDGAPVWAKTFPLNAIFASAKLAGAENGDVVLSTGADHDVDFGGGTLPGNIFSSNLVRYDEGGEHLFSQVVESSTAFQYTSIHSVAIDSGGDSWVVGRFSGDVLIGGSSLDHAGEALFLAEVDRAGVFVDGQVIEATDCQLALRAVPGGMLLGGPCAGPVDFGAGPVGTAAGSSLLALYDEAHELAWALDLGGTVDSLCFDGLPDGGALVGGSFLGELAIGDDRLVAVDRRDAFVAVISASGAVEATQRFGDEFDERIEDLRVRDDGFVAIGTGLLEDPDLSLPYPLLEVASFGPAQ